MLLSVGMIWTCMSKLKVNKSVWLGQTERIAEEEVYFKRGSVRVATFQPVSANLSLKMYHFTLETASHESQNGRHSGLKEAHMHRMHTHACRGTHTHTDNHACSLKFHHWHSTCTGTMQSKGPVYAHCVVLRPWVIVSGNVICQNILWHCRSTP